jgi:hypothetical protein
MLAGTLPTGQAGSGSKEVDMSLVALTVLSLISSKAEIGLSPKRDRLWPNSDYEVRFNT